MTPDKKHELRDLIDDAVKDRIDANRRFVNDLLEKIQDGTTNSSLKSSGTSCGRWRPTKAGDLRGATHHRVMADVYKSILERCFC
jgi:hypothetical protein